MTVRRYPVHVTRIAEEDLNDIHDFIAADDPHRAARIVAKLLDRIRKLDRHPRANPIAYESRPGRELRHVIASPFRVVYEVQGKRVVVLAVRHMKRRPAEFP